MSVALFTNNPLLLSLPHQRRLVFAKAGPHVAQAVTSNPETPHKTLFVLFDTDATSVLTTARDCIHQGWKLLHHPLYGNYRPYQQPYRSLVLTGPAPGIAGPDLASLQLIEEALLVYADNKSLAPAEAPASLLDACALLDYELMRLPLAQSGIIPEGLPAPELSERGKELSKICA